MKYISTDFLKIAYLVLCFSLLGSITQAQTVSGVVTDANTGESLPGVNIIVQGTATGTATNSDGRYELSVPSLQDTLVFSFVGYQTQMVPVAGRTTVNVALGVSELMADELVVVGYGVQRRSDLTGAIGSVSEEDFNQGITTSPEQLLQGRVAGLTVTQRSGEPGSASVVTIRGVGTVRSGGSPLYVVDGVALSGDADFINPSDIESIDVLKDASATAIYGSRGANGVIIITTKRGNRGAPQLTYEGSYSISQAANTIEVLNAQQFIDFTNEFGDPSYIYSTNINTDWQSEVLRTAYTNNHSLSYGGGTDNSSYYASVSALNQEGIFLESSLERYIGRLNVNQRFLNDRLNVGINLTSTHTHNINAPISTGPGVAGDALSNALTANPTYPTHNEDGTLFHFPEGINPLMRLDIFTNFSKINQVLGNIEASYRIIEGLEYRVNFAVNNSQSTSISQVDKHNVTGGEGAALPTPEGRLTQSTNESDNILAESFLTYMFDVEDHRFNLLGGYSYQKFSTQSRSWSINNFSTTEIDAYRNPGIGTDLSIQQNRPNGSAAINELQSLFGRANYSFLDKYFLTATLRADGSSKFGANNRYGIFPSFSVAWQLSDEAFLSDIDALTNLRLRTGWGQTGNQDIPSYITHQLLSISTGVGAGYYLTPGSNSPGINLVRAQNEDIKWEVSTQANIGLDFGFLEDRIFGTIDFFDKRSTDILWESATGIDPIVPTSSYWNNYDMEIQNQGVELSLGYRQFIGNDLSIDIGGNVSFIKNNVTNLPVQILRTGSITGQGLSGVQVNGFLNNHPAGTFWVLDWIGLDEDGFNAFRDVDGDGSITDGDFVDGGTGLPSSTYGGYVNVAYKGFDLSVNFNGVSGNKTYWNDENAYFNYPRLMAGNNVAAHVLQYTNESKVNSATPSTRYIHDGSFFRLNNATIGYNVNTARLDWLRNLRFYVTGQNLFVITDYPGFDPEVDINRASSGFRSTGIDATAYPRSRTFMLGVNFTF